MSRASSKIDLLSALGGEYNAFVHKINAEWHAKTGQKEIPITMLSFVFERVFPDKGRQQDSWLRCLEAIGRDNIEVLVERVTKFIKGVDLTFINLAEKIGPIHEVIRQVYYSGENSDPEIRNLAVLEVARRCSHLEFIQFLYDLTEPIRVAGMYVDTVTKPAITKMIWEHFIDESVLTSSGSMHFYLKWREKVLKNETIMHGQFNREQFDEIREKIVSFLKFLQTCYDTCNFMQAVGKLVVLTGTREDEHVLDKAQSEFLVAEIMYTKPYQVNEPYVALPDNVMTCTNRCLVTFPFLQTGRYKVEEYTGPYKVGQGPSVLKIRFVSDEKPSATSVEAASETPETGLTQE